MLSLVTIVHAQTFSNVINKNPTIKPLLEKISENIISPIVAVMFGIAFVVFVWGVAGMILNSEDSEKRKNSQNSILWGVVGMVIMISVYGIVRLIASTVGGPDPFN